MLKYKKILAITVIICGYVLANDQAKVEQDDSGKERVLSLLKTQKVQSAFVPAETKNIFSDLNIPAITSFFNCITEVGRWYLQESLNNPLKADSELIEKRKSAIKLLTEDKELKAKIEEIIKESQIHEKTAMMLLSDYFKGSACPELKKLEETKSKSRMQYLFSSFMTKSRASSTFYTLFHALMLAGGSGIFAHTLFSNVAVIKTLSIGLEPIASIAYGLFMTGVGTYRSYKDYSTSSEKRTKIHALHKLLKLSEKLEQLSQQKGLVLQHPLSKVTDKESKDLMSSIRSSRYAYENSYIFAVPLVHSFLYKLYEKEQHLASLFASIAEMDVYNAIATKIIEANPTEAPFCFAQYLPNKIPTIQAEKLWYVIVKNPVLNDFNETNNIILTGPNAGGKSTFIRSVLQNIVMAQTYGVAAAHRFAFTPFDVIHTYLNIQDDPIRKKSRYLVELEVGATIKKTQSSLSAGEKYFWTTDELFSGTGEQDGGKVAYDFVEGITSSKNYDAVMFIFATHFEKMTTLETEGIARCKNYKVDPPVQNDQGEFVYPYTISPGINTSGIAYDLASKAGLFKQ